MQKSKTNAQKVLKLKETHPEEQGRTTERLPADAGRFPF